MMALSGKWKSRRTISRNSHASFLAYARTLTTALSALAMPKFACECHPINEAFFLLSANRTGSRRFGGKIVLGVKSLPVRYKQDELAGSFGLMLPAALPPLRISPSLLS